MANRTRIVVMSTALREGRTRYSWAMRLPNTHLVLAFALVPSLAVVACDPLATERCNTDDDCGRFTCILGQCVDRDRAGAFVDDEDGAPDNAPVVCDAASGTILAFADVDGDGHGAGPGFCASSMGPGVVELGDDCNDLDASAFALRTVFVDEDGDGFTGGATLACVGDTFPLGTFASPRGAPVRLAGADDVIVNDGTIDPHALIMESSIFENTASFTLTGVECAAPLDVVTGLDVRLDIFRERATNASFEIALIASAGEEDFVDVAVGTFASGDVEGVAGAEDGVLSIAFGNDGDNAPFDAALLCAGDLEITFEITVFDNDERSAFAFDVEARVFGANDCDDGDSDVFSPAFLRIDGDADGFGEGELLEHCIGNDIPLGLTRSSGDCAPDDERAFPGQDTRFSSPRLGVGGFDYNCDGIEEKRLSAIDDVTVCQQTGPTCEASYATRTPACGTTISIGYCSSSCNYESTTFTQTCR